MGAQFAENPQITLTRRTDYLLRCSSYVTACYGGTKIRKQYEEGRNRRGMTIGWTNEMNGKGIGENGQMEMKVRNRKRKGSRMPMRQQMKAMGEAYGTKEGMDKVRNIKKRSR
jgi:hypothetical protein